MKIPAKIDELARIIDPAAWAMPEKLARPELLQMAREKARETARRVAAALGQP